MYKKLAALLTLCLLIACQTRQPAPYESLSKSILPNNIAPKVTTNLASQRLGPGLLQVKTLDQSNAKQAGLIVNHQQTLLQTKNSLSQLALQKNKHQWLWPVKGKVSKKFLENHHSKGIDIVAQLGTPIKATLAGTVVYQGAALKGYGKLIIIKHDEFFLSAYAHNDTIKVKEGELVRQGQVISTMGQTGADSCKLHFEIRYQGKPIDPSLFLKA